MSTTNWDKVQDWGFKILPAGTYNVQISAVTEELAFNGSDIAKLTLTVLDGDLKGQTLTDTLWLTESGKPKQKALYLACGVPAVSTRTLTPDMLVGRKVIANIIVTKFENKKIGKEQEKNEVAFGSGYERHPEQQMDDPKNYPIEVNQTSDLEPF